MSADAMGIESVTVVGGGTMGNGIAHVCALSGRDVRITDVSQDVLDVALATISKNLDRQVKKEVIDEGVQPICGQGDPLHQFRRGARKGYEPSEQDETKS